MSYPTKLLNDHETIALDMHPHWWYFAKAGGAALAAAILAVLSAVWGVDWLTTALLVVMGLCVVWLVVRYLKWTTTNFVVTSDRVIYRSGVVAKHGIEIPLDRVNNVNFHQRLIERMIGTGDLLIESASEEGQSRFTDIRHPDDVQNMIHKQIYTAKHQFAAAYGAGAQPQVATTDVATQLEKLEGMLQRGSLSQAEFDAQKRKLLGITDPGNGTPHLGSPLPPPPPGAGR